jgi:hypothetical protein
VHLSERRSVGEREARSRYFSSWIPPRRLYRLCWARRTRAEFFRTSGHQDFLDNLTNGLHMLSEDIRKHAGWIHKESK